MAISVQKQGLELKFKEIFWQKHSWQFEYFHEINQAAKKMQSM